ncbi:MAG: hypothetical protein WBN04_00815 [Paracoccaceae bacterium]
MKVLAMKPRDVDEATPKALRAEALMPCWSDPLDAAQTIGLEALLNDLSQGTASHIRPDVKID